jgi:hypothetical protein
VLVAVLVIAALAAYYAAVAFHRVSEMRGA